MSLKLFKTYSNNQLGQSIIEVLIAISILSIVATGTVIAVLGSFSSTRLSKEETQANFLASEGIEAVKSIRNQSWDNLNNGDHGISRSLGYWSFSGTQDTQGKFTRVITISDVYRSGGDIITTGGTVDPDTKKIEVTVSWNFTSSRNNRITMTQYVTNWLTVKSKGIYASCITDAECLSVDITNVSTGGSGQKQLLGITLGNINSTTAVIIDQMRVTWSGGQSSSIMNTIRINGSNVWTGNATSGSQVNITNTTISARANNIPINYIQFSRNMNGATFTIEFTMADGTTKTVSNITP